MSRIHAGGCANSRGTGDCECGGVKPTPPPEQLRTAALALYRSPFRYDVRGGYVWDANNEMVAGKAGSTAAQLLEIRGWGRLQYLPDGAALQDEVGRLIAQALNEFWLKNK